MMADSAEVANTRFGQIAIGINCAGAVRFEGAMMKSACTTVL